MRAGWNELAAMAAGYALARLNTMCESRSPLRERAARTFNTKNG
jgi:hypothetical protein